MPQLVATNLDFNSVSRILNLPVPQSNGEPVRLQDLTSAVEGLAWKDSCRVGTFGNLNLASPGANIDSITMAAGDRVLVRAQSLPAENGIYIWNGAAVAMTRALDASTANELESAVTTIEESGTSLTGTTWRQTAVNFTLDSAAVNWTQFGSSTPAATTTTSGTVMLATQAEVDTNSGAAQDKVVTVSTFNAFPNRKLKASSVIGDGTSTQFDVTHNFNTRLVSVSVYRNVSPWDDVICDVSRPDANTVRLNFSSAPAANAFAVVVLG